MSDIPDRLLTDGMGLVQEAAAEITHLRAEVERLKHDIAVLPICNLSCATLVARAEAAEASVEKLTDWVREPDWAGDGWSVTDWLGRRPVMLPTQSD